MGQHRITPAVSEIIRRGKASGKTSRDIVQMVHDQLGFSLDQRSISRHLLKFGNQPQPAKQPNKKPPKKQAKRPGANKPPADDGPAESPSWLNVGIEDHEATLDEVAALSREVLRLQNLLGADIPNRDRVAIVAELRQTLRAIRLAKTAAKQAQTVSDAEVKELKSRLKRFAFRNVRDFNDPEASTEETSGVPPLGRAASGE